MSQIELTKELNGYKYVVSIDEDACLEIDQMFEKEQAEEIKKAVDNDELTPYSVEEYERCKCCDSWVLTNNAIYGYFVEIAEDALDIYLQDRGIKQ